MAEPRTNLATVLALLDDIRDDEDFAASTNFFEDGLLDSFDIVTLVHGLEEAFEINIDGTDILVEHFMNLAALRALLAKYEVQT